MTTSASPASGDPAAGSRTTRRVRLYLVATLLASLLLKVQLAVQTAEVPLLWDEADFHRIAKLLAEHGLDPSAFPGAFRSPGYPYFLALVILAAGPKLLFVRLAQAVVSTLSSWLLFVWARRDHGETTALVACVLASFLPELVGSAHLLWSETIFIFLMLLFLDLVDRYHRSERLPWALASGVAGGLAVLVKTAFATYPPLAAIVVAAWPGRRGAGRRGAGRRGAGHRLAAGGLLLAAYVATLSPWLARNAAEFGRPLLSTGTWLGVWSGNHFPDDTPYLRYRASGTEVKGSALARRESLRYIRSEGWNWLPGKVVRNVPLILGPANFNLRHMWLGMYGPVSASAARAIVVVCAAGYFAVVLLACAGLVAAPASPARVHTAIIVLQTVAMHVVLVAMARYRLPLMPLLCVPAACALVHARALVRRSDVRLAVAAGMLLLAWSTVASTESRVVFDLWEGRRFDPRSIALEQAP